MRELDRRLDEQNKQKNKPQDDEPDQVEIMTEMPRMHPLDTAKSVFDEGVDKRWGGINTRPSAFDAKAVFRVRKSEE